jgi:hypothetical protein
MAARYRYRYLGIVRSGRDAPSGVLRVWTEDGKQREQTFTRSLIWEDERPRLLA